MPKKIRLKVYGTIKGEKRILRKGHYYKIARTKSGKFKSLKKWSPKQPCKKPEYVEKYIEKETGKEAKEEVIEKIIEDMWEEYGVEYA